MQRIIRRGLVWCAGTTLLVLLAGCASLFPGRAPDDTPPADTEPGEAAEATELPVREPEPVLTIPEAYDAISLSVQAGDPEAAIAAYQEAELDDPDDPATRVLLANLYLVAGELEEADAILDGVLAAEPDNTEAVYLRALIRGAAGDTDAQRAPSCSCSNVRTAPRRRALKR